MDAVWDEFEHKMAEMKIAGFSSMGQFTAEEHLEHLEEISRIRERRGSSGSGLRDVNESEKAPPAVQEQT